MLGVILAAVFSLAVVAAAPSNVLAAPTGPQLGAVDDGVDPDGVDPNGVTVVAVELSSGFEHPKRPSVVEGARAEVPAERSTLLLTAAIDTDLSVRFHVDGTWGPWVELSAAGDEGPDSGDSVERAAGPVRVPEGAISIEVVRLGGTDRTLDLTFLLDTPSSLDNPSAPVDSAPAPRVAGAQQVQPGERPPIVPRSSWASEGWAVETDGCQDGPSYADNLQALVVHHTVTSNSYAPAEVDDILRAIHYGHVRINGWCDIGYNFVVDRFGTIWEARLGGVERPVIGGHAKGFNTATVGVAMLGQHQSGASPSPASPSPATRSSIQALAEWKLGRYGVDPTGTTWLKNRSSKGAHRLASGRWHLVPTVLAHRDLGLTSCPGSLAVDFVRAVPDALALRHPGAVPYRFDAWTPYDIGPGFVAVDRRAGLRPSGTVAVSGIGALPEITNGPVPLPSPPPIAVGAHRGGGAATGYTLHADGVLRAFGSSPAVADRPAGSAIAVDLALGESGGWVVSADGGVHGFGGRADLAAEGRQGKPVLRAALDSAGNGYLLEVDGRLRPVGNAPAAGPVSSTAEPIDIALRPAAAGASGGWVLDAVGGLHAFGGAPSVELSSPEGPAPGRRYQAIVSSASGHGGWLLTDDGQLWPFGSERLILGVSTETGFGTDKGSGPGGSIDVAIVSPVVSEQFLGGSTGRYLNAVVGLFLDRPATAADYGHWQGRMSFYSADRHDVTLGLARSDEWAGVRVDAMYRDVLGRPADVPGRRYWLEQMVSGLPLQRVGVYFYGSAEYVTAAGSNSAYVTRLYNVLLERPPDESGLAYWVGRLDSGRAVAPDVAAGFYSSPESRRSRVVGLYQEVLDRDPDADGLGYWTERLLDIDDVILAAELAASDEFHARSQNDPMPTLDP